MKHLERIFVRAAAVRALQVVGVLTGVLLISGCGGKPVEDEFAPAPAVSAATAVALPAPAAVVAPPPVAVAPGATTASGPAESPFSQPDQGANDRAMAQLNEALRKFQAQYERAPYTADELVAEKFVESMPQAPEGKEYFYDSVALRFKLINKRPQ